MTVSLADFCAALIDLKLVAAEEFRELMTTLPPRQLSNIEALAKTLVSRNILTKYQAQAILNGQAKRLVLGSYLLVDQIGKGGMGVILKAQHQRLKKTVAIKVLSPQVTQDQSALKRFQREVQALSKLEHPHVVSALDADVSRGVNYLVMQYVEGRDLATVVLDQGPLSVEQAVRYLSQAASGLEYAHQLGIIHRDIKPANLLIEKATDTVKVLDLGLARIEEVGSTGQEGETGLTNTGTIMGTVDYMSPEQAANTKRADHRTDIYSLGISLYYLLTGQLPYQGDTVMEKLLAHREQPIPSLRACRADIPEAVDSLFRKLVAKRPQDRYQSMSETLAALLSCLAGAPTTAAAPVMPRGSVPIAVAEDSVNSEFRAFVTALNKESDTDAGFVPGQVTEVSAVGERPSRTRQPGSSRTIPMGLSGVGQQLKSAPKVWLIGGGIGIALLVFVGGLWFRGGFAKPAAAGPDGKPTKVAKSGGEKKGAGTKGAKGKVALKIGPPATVEKLASLPPGDLLPAIPGLIAEPPKIDNRRWQVETLAPRSGVNATAWSPDGRQVVLGCQLGELRVYDVPSWKLRSIMLPALHGTGSVQIRSVAWNPEGSRIAAVSNVAIHLWQADGTPGPILRDYSAPGVLAWSPDGKYLIVASSARGTHNVQMFGADGKALRVCIGHSGQVRGLAWSADGQYFVSASEDSTLRIWNLEGESVLTLSDHFKGLTQVAWSRNGQIAAADSDGTVYHYRSVSGDAQISAKINPKSLAWSPDGTRLAVGMGNQVQVWNTDEQVVAYDRRLDGTALSWSPDGTRLLSGGPVAAIWDLADDVNKQTAQTMISSLATDPTRAGFVSGHASGAINWWDDTGLMRATANHDATQVSSIAWSSDGRTVATGSKTDIRLWDRHGEPRGTINTKRSVNFLKWSPDQSQLALSSGDAMVRLIAPDGTDGPVLEGHTQNIVSIDWSSTGQIAAAARDGSIRTWDKDGKAGPIMQVGKNQEPLTLAWSPDGTLLAVNIGQRSETRYQLFQADGSVGPGLRGAKSIPAFAWTADGSHLVGCDGNGDFQVWNKDGTQGPLYPGIRHSPRILVWSKSDRAVTVGEDKVLRYWDTVNFHPLWFGLTLTNGHRATVSADGRTIHSSDKAEQLVTYLLERIDGRMELLSPEQFDKLTATKR